MWAYGTCIKTLTGQTLFALAFGIEAVAPTELVWPTTRIKGYKEERNEEMQVGEGNILEKIREEAILREEKVKRMMSRYYNAKTIPKVLRIGDLVLKNS